MAVLTLMAMSGIARAYRRWCTLGLMTAMTVFLNSPATTAAPSAANAEYQIKAVFLFNFAQFVTWPERAFERPKSPLIIGVLGDDPFGAYLDEVVRGEKVGEREITALRFHRVEEINECHILFVSRSEAGQLDKIIAHLKGRSVLSVSDIDSFSRQGGMVRFVTENSKIRMRINLEVAKAAGLEISSKLLRPATIVTEEKN